MRWNQWSATRWAGHGITWWSRQRQWHWRASPTCETRPSHRLDPARPFSHLSAARRKRAWRPRAALARPFMSAKVNSFPAMAAPNRQHQAGTRCPDPRFQAGSYIALPSLSTLVTRHQSAKSSRKDPTNHESSVRRLAATPPDGLRAEPTSRAGAEARFPFGAMLRSGENVSVVS